MPESNPPRHSLRMSIITAFTGLFLLLVCLIIGFNTYFGHKASMKTSDQLFERAGSTAINKTRDFLKPAIHHSHFFERMIHQGHIDPANLEEVHDFCMQSLRVFEQFNGCFYANQYGMWGAEIQEEGVINVQSRHRENLGDRQAFVHDRWFNEEDEIIKEDRLKSGFDPRIRPWYLAVKEKLGPVWSEPYLFYNPHKVEIGVSATVPILNPQGEFNGATLIDITMDALSEFLNQLTISPSSLAFIIDQNGKVLCFPQMEEVVKGKGHDKELINIVEMQQHPHLIEAYAKHNRTSKSRVFVDSEAGTRIVQFVPFGSDFDKPWKMVITALESDFTTELKRSNQTGVLISLGILLASILFISMIARNISQPIQALIAKLQAIRELNLTDKVNVKSPIREIAEISNSIESLRNGLQAFKMYVPAGLVKDLVETGETARLGGKNEILTVFFSDIADFTTISEGLPPEYLGQHLSEYLDEMSQIITSCHGTIDKYIGDAIMAFWNAPHKDLNHELNACEAALLCQRKLLELEQRWAKERKPMLKTRIGIHTGPTVVGNMGSSERMNYTVIGDSVNLASRIEGVNKAYGTGVIISESTATRARERFLIRPLDTVRVKGKSEPIRIFELLDFRESAHPEMNEFCERTTEAYEAYRLRNFEQAVQILQSILQDFPEDGPSQILLSRSKHFLEKPPADNWDGTLDGLRIQDICS